MSELIVFAEGGYSFLKGGFPYSQGVRALPGYAIERVRFARPLPVQSGFAAIERYLASIGRPRTALCAAELRSPRPFSMQGFTGFNQGYVDVLQALGAVSAMGSIRWRARTSLRTLHLLRSRRSTRFPAR